MTDLKVSLAVTGALTAFTKYGSFDAAALNGQFNTVFASDGDFLTKVDLLDAAFDEHPQLEELREVFFDLLMINFFSEDVKKLEDDYLETPEWEDIEEQTLDRGTELLNLLLYLNECEDEDIDPELEDYLKEFLLVDEDEFQDEYRIYEPVIAHQVLVESPVSEVAKVAKTIPEDSEVKELFYPMICFFQNPEAGDTEKSTVADSAINKPFDMAVLEILFSFK
ncbi:hypothetical protein [Mucilaginibacter phyllosphaerae]|uniref:Uncharacterized protein n=1 Tax=Mucilaginibacter phyllosphaerae TaxID=1812349 RepID=A0A4Y8AI96_9SPHI|nr:hypothetical protein [Mucilaginibacter phyllosphaerae]MBB3968182.1 hypothetical protein [Mucilaginibacter phyllosphaerae]TEW68807.1 hypothetical protein E2R65_01170 [Mucilaginibacter phyllosphaerae]GGH00663.1 hypothetical protein GCM10007352_02080 [Mucilaginibacter phyllosphaerae]